MSTSEISAVAFEPYWQSYATAGEAVERAKKAWRTDSLSKGIVQASLKALATCLTVPTKAVPQVATVGTNIYFLSQCLYWNGIRIELIGTSCTSVEVLSSLTIQVRERSREALCICVLPSVTAKLHERIAQDVSDQCYVPVFFFPDDLDALALADWDLTDLLEYKTYRSLVLEKPAPETQYDRRLVTEFRSRYQEQPTALQSVSDVLHVHSDDPRRWAQHPSLGRVMNALRGGRSCLLIGPSAGGKTVLALEAGRQCADEGMSVFYLNMGAITEAVPFSLVQLLASSRTRHRTIYILDDLQSNPQAAHYLCHIANLSRRAAESTPILILGVSWPDFAQSGAQFLEDCLPVYVRPKDVRQAIISEYSSSTVSIIENRDASQTFDAVKDDLQLLRIYIEACSQRQSEAPTLFDIAASYWSNRTTRFPGSIRDAELAVLIVASLGRYDLSVAVTFVEHEAHLATEVIPGLLQTGLLRLSQSLLTVGHRSLAALLADWLASKGLWTHLKAAGGPEDPFAVARDYLRSASPALALGTLRALQTRAGFKESSKLNSRTAALVSTWKAFNALLERIEHQQSLDPHWGAVLSSVMFAVQSLAEIGSAREALPSIRFLRSKYSLDGRGQLEIDTSGLTTLRDFELIAQAMKEQDELTSESNVPSSYLKAGDIDIERFHKTWLSGVILCTEAACRQAPDSELELLASAVAREQLPSGAFYPERAIWSTARVCIGLAASGMSVHTDASLRKTIDWLLLDTHRGGACDAGLWLSGTKPWNSDLEVTAMTLLACVASGIDPDDDRLKVARSFLISQSDQWIKHGHELDGALAAQAYLESGGAWDDIVDQVQRLSEWAQGEAFWRTATFTSEQSFEQSCRVAQIASHLLAIGWSAIRADLPLLLQALDAPETHGLWRSSTLAQADVSQTPLPPFTDNSSKLTIADSMGDPSTIELLESIVTLRVEDLSVVGKYCRSEEKIRNQLKDWKNRLTHNFVSKACTHENFLIWAAPGSGKSFFITEIAASLAPAVKYVELNLAKSKEEFCELLAEVTQSVQPTLCLVDEIDARKDELWPFETLFPHLDRNLSPDHSLVFVLVGSSRAGKNGMIQEMNARPKGPDLLDRIPLDRRFEIPPLSLGDRATVFAANASEAALTRRQTVKAVEKFAIYYVLTNTEFASPRQLRDLAYSAVGRLSSAEDRIHYDNLFAAGDRRNQQFWAQNQLAAARLADLYANI